MPDAPEAGVVSRPWQTIRADLDWGPLHSPDGSVHLKGGDEIGYHRGTYPWIDTAALRGHLVKIPSGNGAPWHHVSEDSIFSGVQGEIELYALGQIFRLGRRDRLALPGGTAFSYLSVGDEDAVWFTSIPNRGDTGYRKTVYFDHEPTAEEVRSTSEHIEKVEGSITEPAYVPWTDARRQVSWRTDPAGFGHSSGLYPTVRSTFLANQIIRIPSGNTVAGEVVATDQVILGMGGEAEALVPETSPLGYRDLVKIPGGSTFELSNPGESDAYVMRISRHRD